MPDPCLSSRSILVCDGDLQSVRALRAVLGEAGLNVHATQTAHDALDRAALRAPDAAIIEIALPDTTGVDLCAQLRDWSTAPILVLSAVYDESSVVAALEAGADDYIAKPFRPRELLARLSAHLRRRPATDERPEVFCDGLEIDLASRVVRRADGEVRLTPIEHKLLRALIEQRGRLLTHNELLRRVWGIAYIGDRQTLRAHVANLRRKLGSPESGLVIRTYPGAGYLLEAREDLPSGPRTPKRQDPRPFRIVRAA